MVAGLRTIRRVVHPRWMPKNSKETIGPWAISFVTWCHVSMVARRHIGGELGIESAPERPLSPGQADPNEPLR